MEKESPEFKKLIFTDQKERPREAPFWALEKLRLNEDLKWTAGLAPELNPEELLIKIIF
jgi:hypothetical protein